MKFRTITVVCFAVFAVWCSVVLGKEEKKEVPWDLKHFDEDQVPRISAEDAMKLMRSGIKIFMVDVPWSDKEYHKEHVCGAIKGAIEAEYLDRLIKKIPKDFLIISYCK